MKTFAGWGLAMVAAAALAFSFECAWGQADSTAGDAKKQEGPPTSYDREIAGLNARAEAEVKAMKEEERAALARGGDVRRNRQEEELGHVAFSDAAAEEERESYDSRVAERERQIRQRYNVAVEDLKKRKAKALEKAEAEQVPMPPPQAKAGAATRGPGLVTGIVHVIRGGAALVDGKVVRPGNIVRGVKVVAITPDVVSFEKNGQRWSQRVRQNPSPIWQTSEPQTSPAPDRSSPNQAPAGRQ